MNLLSKADAKAQGLRHYFTGNPCRHGHVDQRFVSDSSCVSCATARARKWDAENPEAVRQSRKNWTERNPERAQEIKLNWLRSNPEKVLQATKDWKNRNPDKVRESRNRRNRERFSSDPLFRLTRFLRVRLRSALKGREKVGSFIQELGCTIGELQTHIEAQWQEGMSWDNYVLEWQIDHVNALGLFDLTDPTQLAEAAHYTNLKPLWKADHRVKTKADLAAIRARKAA